MRLHLVVLPIALTLSACAGHVDYARPMTQVQKSANVKVIDKPRDAVWSASVPELGKQFFVINNLDKSSGFINISYTGDPEKYIDCGRITSFVQNARGARTYDFPASRAQMSYEVMNNNGLFFFDRRMSLDGRVNLVFEELSPNQTRITANTRYVVQREQTMRSNANNIPQSRTDSISFNSASGATFPSNGGKGNAECVSNGVLEKEILSAIK